MLLVGREEEIGQELGDRHPPTVAQVDIFRNALNDVDDLHLLVELQPFLAIIPEAHSLADIESSAVGLHFAHQHFNKGRFPRPIIADDAQLLVAGEDIVEVFRDDNIVESLRDVLRLEYLRTDIRRFHVEVHLSRLALLLGLFLQFVESIDAVFRLRPSGLRLAAHPVQLLAEEVRGALHFGILCLDAFGAFLQIIIIVSFIRIDLLAVNLENLVADAVEEVAVVRYHQQTDIRPAQVALEPFGHLEVEVVRRLVEDNQLRVGNQDIRQRNPFQLPAGELPDTLLEVVNLQLSKDLLRPLLIIPSLEGIHADQQILEPPLVAPFHRLLVFGNEAHRLVLGIETRLEDGHLLGITRSLLQIADAQIVAEDHRAAVVVLLPSDDVQERRLPAPIFGDKPNLLSLLNAEGNILEEHQVAEALG